MHQSNPEVHRAMLSIPEDITFSVPFKNVGVMRHTSPSIDNASEHALNDCWNDDRTVMPSEAWVGTTRFQIPKIKAQKDTKWVNGQHTHVQNTTRRDTIWPEQWP